METDWKAVKQKELICSRCLGTRCEISDSDDERWCCNQGGGPSSFPSITERTVEAEQAG